MTGKSNEIAAISHFEVPDALQYMMRSSEPLLVKGLVVEWPLVQAGLVSPQCADSYLRQFYSGKPVVFYKAAADKKGRFFYNSDCTALDFETGKAPLDHILDEILRSSGSFDSPAYYVGSTTVDTWLPGLRSENDLKLDQLEPLVSLWLGNQSRVAAHFDAPNNIACCVAGRRRFTLFAPDQVENLYIGPLHFTPSGQAISMVDFHSPDSERFPNFNKAMANAYVAELEPGDALYIPPMWWHHVESLDDFNILINYWWRKAPQYVDPPLDVLYHAMLCIRDLPANEKKAWKYLFTHYIFDDQEDKYTHIPENARGFLDPLDGARARQLRTWLLNRLNR